MANPSPNFSPLKTFSTGAVIPEAYQIQVPVYRDERGFFMEAYHSHFFLSLPLKTPVSFFQDNFSVSAPGVLRGLHYQTNPAQGKYVGIAFGKIWDVLIDLRVSSPTYGQGAALTLEAGKGDFIWIPPGFAHGFCVLGSEPAGVFYKVTAPYSPSSDTGIFWKDADLQIPWPLTNPLLSNRDATFSSFQEYQKNPVFLD